MPLKEKLIVDILEEGNKHFVQLSGDEDNIYEFVKTKFMKKPLMRFPCEIIEGRAVPCEGFDAMIDLRHHVIKFKNVKDEDHMDIQSLTSGGNYSITMRDLRPMVTK